MAENVCYLLLILVTVSASLVFTRAIRRAFSRFRSHELKIGKELIYRHFPKRTKPLGGGVAVFLALVIGALCAVLISQVSPYLQGARTPHMWIWLLCGLTFGGIGFIDDWRKVNAAHGLSDWVKLSLQLLCAAVFTIWIVLSVRGGHSQNAMMVYFPFIGWRWLGWMMIPFGMVVIVAMSNAVNLTDGMDGLAGSSLAVSYAGYLLLSVVLPVSGVPVLIPWLLLAALAGFLYYNRPTARIIMGDTGALGLGAALGALALISSTEWLLLLLAAPCVIDMVSVIIQVLVIKFFRGPVKLLRHQTTEIFRPFLCTPLHHHFQWLTWGPWPILALFNGVGVLSVIFALLAAPAKDGMIGFSWFWVAGLLLQGAFLLFAVLQKMVRANYFLGLHHAENTTERTLALYKGLPVEFLGVRWYTLEEITNISENMINTIAAESILWRNISEIEARATLGKIFAEYKFFDKAAEEWEEIPLRNLLIRENLVVQLGKIYFGRDELLRAIKLWECLPSGQLARFPGLAESIQSAKVRVGHLAGRLFHQAREHAAMVAQQTAPAPAGIQSLIHELEGALRYTQDLRELLAYEQQHAESLGELDDPGDGPDLYRRMNATLSTRQEQLHEALRWAQQLLIPKTESAVAQGGFQSLAEALQMTSAEISRALDITDPLPVSEFMRIQKPSRNNLYRVTLTAPEPPLPKSLIAKCFEEQKVTFFSACYRRERGVLQILQSASAPVPRLLGGHLGPRLAVLFLEDLGTQDLASAMQALAPDDLDGRLDYVRRGLDTLVMLRVQALTVLPRLEHEIAKIVKEVLTPEYYLNTIIIALNRILALERHQLSVTERGRLEVALHPLIALLQDEPKTFIHFEYTPGNLHLVDGHAIVLDFEQATLGPAAFDLATLFYSPEANLDEASVADMLACYHALIPPNISNTLRTHPAALEAAAIIKMLFYAGSAANFYRKFEEGNRLEAMEWYLRTADRLLQHTPDYHDLGDVLRRCWQGQTHLPV